MAYNNRRNIIDILSLNPTIPQDVEVLRTEYRAVDIDKVVIDEIEYTNYGQYSFILEKTYGTSPKRSSGGRLSNLNSHATYITPHFVIDFSIMSIDDYRSIMRQHYQKNEFIVKCYDPIYNITRKVKMYFATEEMAKLYTINKKIWNKDEWEDWILLAGVRDYTLEMIGTNNDLDTVSVVYHLNPPTSTGLADATQGESEVYAGEELLIGGGTDFQNETFGGIYKFEKWTTGQDNSGMTYIDNSAYTINADLVLYAQWVGQNEHTLSYSYGVADAMINDNSMSYVNSKTVTKGQSIGALPTFTAPDGYYNGKWWKTPVKTKKYDESGKDITDTLILKGNELYWADRDSTIYLLFDVLNFPLAFYIDGELFYKNTAVDYNSQIPYPTLVKNGYTLDGWYTDETYKTKFSGTMPKYAMSLYARWVKNQ